MKNSTPRLPSFIVVGPPRTGTSWLQEVLNGYTTLPREKETQFFVWNYDLGIDWYAAHFKNAPSDRPIGEVAPTYFNSPEARSRIAEYIPNCRIICVLREPVERIYSHYKMWRAIGLVKAPFEYVAFNHKQILDYNRYSFHVRAWQEQFGHDNVLVQVYEDLKADPDQYLRRISDFIGIGPIDASSLLSKRVRAITVTPKSPRLARRGRLLKDRLIRMQQFGLLDALQPVWNYCSGRGEKYGPLDPELKRQLRLNWRAEVEECEKLLNRELPAWKESDEDDKVQASPAAR